MAIVQTIYRTLLCMCDLSSTALGVYGYIFSTGWSIASHITDPYLTVDDIIALCSIEIGLAAFGLAIMDAVVAASWNPFPVAGFL